MTARRAVVAGVGFRRGTPAAVIVALVRRALAEAGLAEPALTLATAADRADEPGFRDAARLLAAAIHGVAADALAEADARVPTRSARVLAVRGVGSLAEAAALAAAGPDAGLLLARIADARATCALAERASG